MTKEGFQESERRYYLPIDETMDTAETMRRLRVNALSAHQRSVGRGDDLIAILHGTIHQLEKTHTRIQNMSTILFVTGLILLAAGIYQIFLGREGEEVWASLLGGLGGISTLAATFWTTPLKQMAGSVTNLVKLETAFLGYIRVIGEADSAFQMQYLDVLTGTSHSTMEKITNETITQVKNAMTHTLEKIDQHVTFSADLTELKTQFEKMEERFKNIEKAVKV